MSWVPKASFPDPSEACACSAVVKVPGHKKTPVPYQRLLNKQVIDFFKGLPSQSLKVTLPDTDSSSSEVILFSIWGNSKIILATSLQIISSCLCISCLVHLPNTHPTPSPRRCCVYLRGETLKDPKSSHALPNKNTPQQSPSSQPWEHPTRPRSQPMTRFCCRVC